MRELPTLDEIIETFELLGDWEERFGYIIDLGKRLPPMPESERTDDARVHGCQAQVWLRLEREGGGSDRLRIRAISDAHIVNGLIAIVMSMYNGRTAAEAMAVDARGILERLELDAHLSGTRRNGLEAMIRRIRALAVEMEAGR
ncbi:MAG: SufE family protein [Phycisphaeraceae bacterium]|nr:SufE family protein [Phycisphaeraceae bacterium]MCW5763622.1 SufE family protein [Phycisphaeraceae bacterium]